MSYQIQLRRDSAANWTSINPILAHGEVGLQDDTEPFPWKIGDGVTAWNSLPYMPAGQPPGGTNGQIQYNNAGVFGGDTSTTDGSGNISLTSININSGTGLINADGSADWPGAGVGWDNGGDMFSASLSADNYITIAGSALPTYSLSVLTGASSFDAGSITTSGVGDWQWGGSSNFVIGPSGNGGDNGFINTAGGGWSMPGNNFYGDPSGDVNFNGLLQGPYWSVSAGGSMEFLSGSLIGDNTGSTGEANQVLTAGLGGAVLWADPLSTPGGSANSIQFNNAGALGGFGAYYATGSTLGGTAYTDLFGNGSILLDDGGNTSFSGNTLTNNVTVNGDLTVPTATLNVGGFIIGPGAASVGVGRIDTSGGSTYFSYGNTLFDSTGYGFMAGGEFAFDVNATTGPYSALAAIAEGVDGSFKAAGGAFLIDIGGNINADNITAASAVNANTLSVNNYSSLDSGAITTNGSGTIQASTLSATSEIAVQGSGSNVLYGDSSGVLAGGNIRWNTLGDLYMLGGATTNLDGGNISTSGAGNLTIYASSGVALSITSGTTSLDNGSITTDGTGNLSATGAVFAGGTNGVQIGPDWFIGGTSTPGGGIDSLYNTTGFITVQAISSSAYSGAGYSGPGTFGLIGDGVDPGFDIIQTMPAAGVTIGEVLGSPNISLYPDGSASFSNGALTIDASGNETVSTLILTPQGAPGSPSPGQIYFDSTTLLFYGWNGTTWITL